MITATHTGFDKVRDWYAKVAASGQPVIEVFTRNAPRNALIANVQAGNDRNPFYSTNAEHSRVLRRIKEALQDGMRIGKAALRDGLQGAGDLYVDMFRKHIQARKSAGVPPVSLPIASAHRTKKLSEKYAKRKLKKFGFTTPELVATNEFRQSFASRVKGV